jgi:hypothetical protein
VALTTVDRTHVRALLDGRPHELSSIDAAAAPTPPAASSRRYVVMGAHPWAGTSTVALALADRASNASEHVVIVDAAGLADSGLLTVAERDLPARDGWAMGIRGAVQVRRPLSVKASPGPAAPNDGLVFVDAGCRDKALVDSGDGSGVVLVCRATVPGLRSAEVALHRLGARGVVLAVVGARRLPNVVRGAAGLRVSELLATGRVVCFDQDRRLAVEGPDDRPLPRPLLASAGRVLDLLEADAVTDGGA